MYCKKCGKKLENNERFCKRCGFSANGESAQKAKKREIEKLNKNRIERNKQRKAAENKKRKLKIRIDEKLLLVLIVLVAISILTVPALISYNMFKKGSEGAVWRTQDGSVKINETASPFPSQKKEEDSSTPYTLTENANEDGYKEFSFDDKIFLYPSNFVKSNTGGESRLKLVDSSGDGVIELDVESNDKKAPQELMLDFAGNNKVKKSRASGDWYNIDVETDVDFIHRKCVVIDGEAISYTLTYPKNSKYSSLYSQYVKYMDEKFTY